MIQRKIFVLCLSLAMFCFTNQSNAQQGKSEISIAYGYWSFFTLLQGAPFSASTGTPNVNYKYYLTNNVTVGMGIGFENNCNWGSLLTFSPEISFKYLDTKDNRIRVRIYGVVAYGLSVFDDWSNSGPGHTDNTGPKLWGFQATPFGIRVGRKFSGFAEIGLGYKGLVNAGMSYRFRTVKKTDHNEH